jgi:hypothetical protein
MRCRCLPYPRSVELLREDPLTILQSEMDITTLSLQGPKGNEPSFLAHGSRGRTTPAQVIASLTFRKRANPGLVVIAGYLAIGRQKVTNGCVPSKAVCVCSWKMDIISISLFRVISKPSSKRTPAQR